MAGKSIYVSVYKDQINQIVGIVCTYMVKFHVLDYEIDIQIVY